MGNALGINSQSGSTAIFADVRATNGSQGFQDKKCMYARMYGYLLNTKQYDTTRILNREYRE